MSLAQRYGRAHPPKPPAKAEKAGKSPARVEPPRKQERKERKAERNPIHKSKVTARKITRKPVRMTNGETPPEPTSALLRSPIVTRNAPKLTVVPPPEPDDRVSISKLELKALVEAIDAQQVQIEASEAKIAALTELYEGAIKRIDALDRAFDALPLFTLSRAKASEDNGGAGADEGSPMTGEASRRAAPRVAASAPETTPGAAPLKAAKKKAKDAAYMREYRQRRRAAQEAKGTQS